MTNASISTPTANPATQPCQLVMLGTGNAMCTRCYNTCFYLRTPGGGLMVDAGGGNGIFRQLHRAHIPVEQVRHMVVTHVHTDHIMGAVWMIRKISPMIHKNRYPAPFTIYCNHEVKHALETMCQLLIPAKINRALGDTIILREVHDGEQLAIDDMQVTFYDIGSDKTLQYGFQAILPDGQRLNCLGDEPYNERNRAYVEGCDWLLCEAFCLQRDAAAFRPYEKHHSTALDAGRIAQSLGVRHLVLYHTEDTHLSTRRLTYTAEAATHFTGSIAVPDDLETVRLES